MKFKAGDRVKYIGPRDGYPWKDRKGDIIGVVTDKNVELEYGKRRKPYVQIEFNGGRTWNFYTYTNVKYNSYYCQYQDIKDLIKYNWIKL